MVTDTTVTRTKSFQKTPPVLWAGGVFCAEVALVRDLYRAGFARA